MFEQIKKILAENLHVDESKITMEAKIQEDLGADSLDVLQILMSLEDDYGITIPDEQLKDFVTVGDIVKYMDSIKK